MYKNYSEEKLKQLAKQLPPIHTAKAKLVDSGININGAITIGYYEYPEEIENWITKFYNLGLIDPDYDNYIGQIISQKYDKNNDEFKYEELTLRETLIIMCYFIRHERFCDGIIAKELESGKLEKLSNKVGTLVER